jgi:hypothetical protein
LAGISLVKPSVAGATTGFSVCYRFLCFSQAKPAPALYLLLEWVFLLVAVLNPGMLSLDLETLIYSWDMIFFELDIYHV